MPDEFESIDEAREALGKDGVKKSSDPNGSVEHYDLDEMARESARQKAKTAATKGTLGLFIRRGRPGGTG